jgi:hypothetical protein
MKSTKQQQKKENKAKQKNSQNANKKTKAKTKVVIQQIPYKKKFFFSPINVPRNIKASNIFSDHKRRLLEYIEGVLDPELAFVSGKPVKQPSIFPIWSNTVVFMSNYNFSTSNTGDFYLAWNPNFLVSQQVLPRFAMGHSGSGSSIVEAQPQAIGQLFVKWGTTAYTYPTYTPDVGLSKYRLVGAKIVMTYVGPEIEKSGVFYACATYSPTAIMWCSSKTQGCCERNASTGNPVDYAAMQVVQGQQIPALTYHMLTEQNITNGLWAKSVPLSSGNKISCVSIPTDPTASIFNQLGTYYGERQDPSNTTYSVDITSMKDTIAQSAIDNTSEGTNICYLLCAKGLPVNKNCINIKVYYNFETIPVPEAAPFLRNEAATSEFTVQETKLVQDIVSNMPPSSNIRVDEPRPVFGKLARFAKTISSGIDKASQIASKIGNMYEYWKSNPYL